MDKHSDNTIIYHCNNGRYITSAPTTSWKKCDAVVVLYKYDRPKNASYFIAIVNQKPVNTTVKAVVILPTGINSEST